HRGGVGLAVAARVVGDHLVPGPRQRLGAVQDLAPGRGDPVAEDDWRPLPRRFASQRRVRPGGERPRLQRHQPRAATARSRSATDSYWAPVRETLRWRTIPSPSMTKIARCT